MQHAGLFTSPTMEREIALRIATIAGEMRASGLDALLLADNVHLLYTSGRVFAGYTYITSSGEARYFVRRPQGLTGEGVDYIRKPEQIAEMLAARPVRLGLPLDSVLASDARRLALAFPDAEIVDASAMMRRVRSVKTPFEQQLLRQDGVLHAKAYEALPTLYRPGMTDLELQIELERRLRQCGCLGLFRIHGQSMELFMASVLAGDNADVPSPYDFAMGGAGCHASLPVGACGTRLVKGMVVMVDACGNFNGYMTDMTRCFAVGPVEELDPLTRRAHETSVAIHRRLAECATPGTKASTLYEIALAMAHDAGLKALFMGHTQQAGFVGHGVGIEVNEAPVLAPRSNDTLQEGNVIAIEPKFVIPHVGAVGIENTYIVRSHGLECITNAPWHIISLA